LREYLRILRVHWRAIVGCTLAAVAAAAALSVLTTPIYQARATLFISTPDSSGVAGAYTGSLFTQQRVKSYVNFVSSPKVAASVVTKLGLSASPTGLASRVTATAPQDTSLINVSVTDPSPTQAQRLTQAVAEEFSSLATSLEASPGNASNVKITIVRPAEVPSAPIKPRTKLNIALGALIGLAIGIAYSVLRELIDTRIKSVAALTEASGSSNLAAIGYDEEANSTPLIVHARPHAPRAEAFRQLRTNLQFIDVDNPPRSIVVTSSVPSEGKSTTACNLAITVSQAGVKTLLLEADLRRPKIGEYLGIETAVGLTDVLIGEVELDDALQVWGATGELTALAAGRIPPNPSELLGSRQMAELLSRLERDYLVIIDAPPLLPVTDAAVLSAVASGAILVVRANSTRKEQVKHAAESLRSVGGRLFGTVYNMASTRGPDAYGYGYGYGYGYYGPDKTRSTGRRGSKKAAASANGRSGGDETASDRKSTTAGAK
jgi:capsular exopolysaccharide synthesis family protein